MITGHCERCNKEFDFDFGKINLICQNCSSTDVKFNEDVLLYPVAWSGETHDMGKIVYAAGDKFNCAHANGTTWDVRPFPKKDEVPVEEEGGEEEKEAEKPTLMKPSKNVKGKIGL